MSADLLRPITRADIKGPALYAGMRDAYLKRMIELKKARRIDVGPFVFLVFDNRFTLQMQVEEVCRIENLVRDDQIQAEIDVQNSLMPDEQHLAATLFVPLPHDANVVEEMKKLVGLDEHVILHVGSHALRASFEAGRSTDEKISAVQYLRFPLSAAARAALATPGTKVSVEIDHPAYPHRAVAGEELRASLAHDYE
jgi:hypothetical protein